MRTKHNIVVLTNDVDTESTLRILFGTNDRIGDIQVHRTLDSLAGALDRLFTYARGDALSEAQRVVLSAESRDPDPPPDGDALAHEIARAAAGAIDQLRATDAAALLDPRGVGRQQAPSTVIGLLFHGAEHAARHAGQAITTSRIVRARPRN